METDEFHIIIPARYQSTRLPAKVLADIHGMSMLEHVYKRALCAEADSITIATDNDEIADLAKSFGADVCMTEESHQSGTERITEVLAALDIDDDAVIINVQADEPLIAPSRIKQLAQDLLSNDMLKVSTLAEPITNAKDMFDPNVVKVVLNKRHYALYFSRSAIPWDQQQFQHPDQSINLNGSCFRHIGLYGYRASYLKRYLEMETGPLSGIESLEQLRILWNGGRIHVVTVNDNKPSISVDTQEDLDQVRAYIAEHGNLY